MGPVGTQIAPNTIVPAMEWIWRVNYIRCAEEIRTVVLQHQEDNGARSPIPLRTLHEVLQTNFAGRALLRAEDIEPIMQQARQASGNDHIDLSGFMDYVLQARSMALERKERGEHYAHLLDTYNE